MENGNLNGFLIQSKSVRLIDSICFKTLFLTVFACLRYKEFLRLRQSETRLPCSLGYSPQCGEMSACRQKGRTPSASLRNSPCFFQTRAFLYHPPDAERPRPVNSRHAAVKRSLSERTARDIKQKPNHKIGEA